MERALKKAIPQGSDQRVKDVQSDAWLLERIRARDERAFEQLADFYFQPVWRVAARVLRNDAEAEDIAQEVFLKVWLQPPELKKGASLRAWLLRVASNGAIDRLRKKRPEPRDDLPELADPDITAEDALVSNAAVSDVQAAMEILPERQRLALVLTYYEGLANKEAADVIGVSVDALESLLSRARRGLKTSMNGVWQELLGDLMHNSTAD